MDFRRQKKALQDGPVSHKFSLKIPFAVVSPSPLRQNSNKENEKKNLLPSDAT